jgi:hypothetical protein
LFSQEQHLGPSSTQPVPTGATVAWARISRECLAKHIERSVDRKKPVRDYILGTTISGESRTTGKTRLVLHASEGKALGEIEFVGEVHAKTIGRNGPATLHYLSDTEFRGRKRLTLNDGRLTASSAVVDAPTRLTATRIRTDLPGLRGQVVERIAWRRVAASRSQADAIASDHTADDIRHDMDRKINESVAAIQSQLSQIAKLQLDGSTPLVMRSRSTPDYIELAVCRTGADGCDTAFDSVAVDGNPDIAIRLHQSVVAAAFRNVELRAKIAPYVGNAFSIRAVSLPFLAKSEPTETKAGNWSMSGEWLVFDLSGSAVPPVQRVALDKPIAN